MRFGNKALPLKQFQRLAERIPETRMPPKPLDWCGNDASARNHQQPVPFSEDPLYLRLHWRAERGAPRRFVGNFELKLVDLLREGYVREEGEGLVRLRLFHGDNDLIYIQRGHAWPGLPIGRLR